jgi:hypothetical protein
MVTMKRAGSEKARPSFRCVSGTDMNGCQPSKAQDGTAQSANHVATFAVYRDNIIYLSYLSNLGSYRDLRMPFGQIQLYVAVPTSRWNLLVVSVIIRAVDFVESVQTPLVN